MTSNLTRVLSGGEENWVKGTAGGSGICVFGCLFSRVIDTQHVCTAVQELLEFHPILRMQIVENAKGKICFHAPPTYSAAREYVDDRPLPPFDAMGGDGIILFAEDHPDKHGSLALHKLVTEELNVNFVNAEGEPSPPLRVFAVLVYRDPSRQQTLILLKSHSAALDRQSINFVAKEFLEKLDMACAVEGRLDHGQKNERAEEGLPAPFEELIPKGKASKGLLLKGFDAVGYAVGSKKYSLLPFDPSFGSDATKAPFQSRFLSVSLGKQGTVLFFDTCTKESVSWAAALTAALLKTIATTKELKEKGKDEFCVTFITDCRPFFECKLQENALGNYISGVPEGFKVPHGIGIWDFARQIFATVEKDMGKCKQFSEFSVLSMLYSQVMKYPSLTPKGSLRTALLNLSVDPPMLGPSSKAVTQLGLVGTVGPLFSNHHVGPCFVLMESLLEGPELMFTAVYSSPLYSHAQMLHILQSSIQLLLEIDHPP